MGNIVKLINIGPKIGCRRWFDIGDTIAIGRSWFLSIEHMSDQSSDVIIVVANHTLSIYRAFQIDHNHVFNFHIDNNYIFNIKCVEFCGGYPVRSMIDIYQCHKHLSA